MSTRDLDIADYLQTGEHDVYFEGWENGNLFERAVQTTADLKAALIAEIQQRAPSPTVPPEIRDLDTLKLIRQKLAPMVSGLFPGTGV